LGPNRFYEPSKRLLRASASGDRTSSNRPGCELLLPFPAPLGIRAEERRRNASRAGRSRPSREICHLKSRLTDIAEGTLSGELDSRRAAVAVQAYNALIRALEQERRVKDTEEQEECLQQVERLLRDRHSASFGNRGDKKMSRRSRIDRAFDEIGGGHCDACFQADDFAGCVHDPEVCDEAERAKGFPRLRALMRAGWFAPDAPKHEHVPISDATRALLDSVTLVVDRDADLAELAEREPQLWRCKEERSGPQALEPCPECGFMPGVVQIIHTQEAAIL
jgi:hypothetical protein